MHVGERIKKLRKDFGDIQETLAGFLGVNKRTISLIEKGDSPPKFGYLEKIIRRYKANPGWLILGDGDPYRAGIDLDQIPRQYCTFVNNLKEIPHDVRTEEYISIPFVEGRIAAGEPIISPNQIKGWAIIHVSQVGHKSNLVAIQVDERTGTSMEPIIRHSSIVAIDRNDREIREKMIYAVRKDGGATVKFVRREGDILMLIPENQDREKHPFQTIDLRGLTYDPIIGRVIWNWQTL